MMNYRTDIDYRAELNDGQYEAVVKNDGPTLVLAGAGTGKTRVITYKIAYLIKELNVRPYNILAVTFTNKASEEMKHRIAELAGPASDGLWIGTFHSIALRILRRDGHLAGLGSGFGVIDQDDRMSLFRSIVKDLNIDPKKYPPKMYMNTISKHKNSPEYVNGQNPPDTMYRIVDVYKVCQQKLAEHNLIDFDDMLALVIRILANEPDIREYYFNLFSHILVDEYQDTNEIQFMFLKLLTSNDGNICVVGDDDQSIYGWRGADIRNILDFDLHFENVTTVKLVENYRSTPAILASANNLIRNNTMRKGKDLIAVNTPSGEITVKKAYNEVAEAEHAAELIEKYINEKNIDPGEIAVLYRTNAQSRNFEVVLNRRGISYKVIGGTGFYQRREVKDILSYLKLFDNNFDAASFKRSISVPKRGVGGASIERIENLAASEGISIFEALKLTASSAKGAQASSLNEYVGIFDAMADCTKISDIVNTAIEKSKYLDFLKKNEDSYEFSRRDENIQELYNAAVLFEENNPEGKLTDFLGAATLVTSTDEEIGRDVRLMTIHSAKGLEFDVVFLSGMESGLFPLYSGMDDEKSLEEERRLCYVGVTRAKKYLHISHADMRMLHGQRKPCASSQFLSELKLMPAVSNTQKRSSIKYATPKVTLEAPKNNDLTGRVVVHEKFGEGKIIGTSGSGASMKADVFFGKSGFKKVMMSFLQLKD